MRFVQWVDPNAEFKGIARYLKHAFAGTAAPAPAAGTDAAPTAPLHPRDVAVVVPNAL